MTQSPKTSDMQMLAIRWTQAQPVVAAYIAGLGVGHHDAEDILQRTAAALVVMQERYDDKQPFVAWAIGAARIEAMRHRQERNREQTVFDTTTVEALTAAFQRSGPELLDIKAGLDRCIAKLGGRVREIFELHYVRELTPTEISQTLKRSTKSIFVALHRGRAAVRSCLERGVMAGGGDA